MQNTKTQKPLFNGKKWPEGPSVKKVISIHETDNTCLLCIISITGLTCLFHVVHCPHVFKKVNNCY